MIRLAIIGAGSMAGEHAKHFGRLPGVEVAAICDLDHHKAHGLATQHGIADVYTELDAMLARKDIQAVSNATPDGVHKVTTLAAIAAGKHILCEKPLATNAGDAREMAEAAREAGVINMINLSYRDAPAIQHARELIAAGAIGRVMHVDASYLQSWLVSHAWGRWDQDSQWLWRLSEGHGSKGVLGDVGVHILDFASFPVGDISRVNCQLKCFDKAPDNRIGDYRLDANDSALMRVEFANGALGTVQATRWATGHHNSLKLSVYGDQGALSVVLDDAKDRVLTCLGDDVHAARWRSVQAPATPSIYQRFIDGIASGVNDQPDFARGAELQGVLDACFQSDAEDRSLAMTMTTGVLA
ncbi:Gfo/Idh/MocA family protein [Halomonas urumqiensis]|uniref:Oxidoreductase n=1 Tax=Halomonas urumqiensis TaxID=1684789 RepID=A0A2N7UD78_9GAMM|nr:Gfo/Idh/MocA family oxidoreductase [Halomonas urumqiensis]PMR78404.1 oxidoreductase [Halomonas urumqiensis]PTB03550.1 gfo/Idh/MocA family oxidoreductase [Halomonas urumqiensis]GHE20249.1 oxidoreductase [Halomonas urumqiensis]